MDQKILIRSETTADVSAITEVTVAAFETLEISNHTEQFIVEALRAAKALAVSLVAEMDGLVIGHIAFFKNVPGLVHEGVPQEFFFALSFNGPTPQGAVVFHEGFKANGL